MSRPGFSLVELLVVFVVVALLLGISLPLLARARTHQRATACLSNLRQVAQGFHLYADANDGYLPDEWSEYSWDGLVAPYLGSERVFICPAEDEGLSEGLGTTYDWRDIFQVDPDVPAASLGGLKLANVKDTSLVLVFEIGQGWHDTGWINAASVDTSARPWQDAEFDANLKVPVR